MDNFYQIHAGYRKKTQSEQNRHMNKYATLDEDVAGVAGDEPSIQKEGRGFEIAAGQVRIPKSTGVSDCSTS